MTVYIAIVHKDKDSDYGVSFPDFPGCVSAGGTLQEAHEMASEALLFHIEGMIEDGEDIPEPSPLEAFAKTPEFRGAVTTLVVEMPQPDKVVRVNVTFVESTLKRIDRYAEEHRTSRSAFLAAAALKAMHE